MQGFPLVKDQFFVAASEYRFIRDPDQEICITELLIFIEVRISIQPDRKPFLVFESFLIILVVIRHINLTKTFWKHADEPFFIAYSWFYFDFLNIPDICRMVIRSEVGYKNTFILKQRLCKIVCFFAIKHHINIPDWAFKPLFFDDQIASPFRRRISN